MHSNGLQNRFFSEGSKAAFKNARRQVGNGAGVPFKKPSVMGMVMAVTLILSSTLRKYVPDYDPVKGLEVVTEAGTTISDLLSRFGIPQKEVKIAMVNGVKVGLETKLEGDERVGLFPAVGGG